MPTATPDPHAYYRQLYTTAVAGSSAVRDGAPTPRCTDLLHVTARLCSTDQRPCRVHLVSSLNAVARAHSPGAALAWEQATATSVKAACDSQRGWALAPHLRSGICKAPSRPIAAHVLVRALAQRTPTRHAHAHTIQTQPHATRTSKSLPPGPEAANTCKAKSTPKIQSAIAR